MLLFAPTAAKTLLPLSISLKLIFSYCLPVHLYIASDVFPIYLQPYEVGPEYSSGIPLTITFDSETNTDCP